MTARKCGAENLTSTKFRKHIATNLQLLCMEENEMEQIATFIGHTKKTHAEFYRWVIKFLNSNILGPLIFRNLYYMAATT
ncbi:hypothetical protein NQ314_017689 [Rhamnusium bicolor]|uniref:Transposase n=1 Tax=Rhamnusium bicolor TaxID=1586634 RepID=A0AAV8WSR2_9CUCU|nr:hypothetical protein NQ314_017689 [Rhamnusium bicolor]